MKTALEYHEKICCELSRARTLHFAHIELQHKPLEENVEYLEMEQCKINELVACYFQCLAEQPKQSEEMERGRWCLEGELDKIAVSGDL